MFGLGFQEILVIFLILLVLFGVKRFPEIGTGLGKTVKEIRKIRDDRRADKEKKKQDQKGNIVSEIKQEIDDLPGLKEARQVKETADTIKNVTKLLK
jgi:TatA/E family protein of Tat protein translocase